MILSCERDLFTSHHILSLNRDKNCPIGSAAHELSFLPSLKFLKKDKIKIKIYHQYLTLLRNIVLFSWCNNWNPSTMITTNWNMTLCLNERVLFLSVFVNYIHYHHNWFMENIFIKREQSYNHKITIYVHKNWCSIIYTILGIILYRGYLFVFV